MISVMKASDNFIHTAWLDHCPNVVVDAKATGCKLYCSSAGGTVELAGQDDVVFVENEWDFQPCALYKPPPLSLTNLTVGNSTLDYNIMTQGELYLEVFRSLIDEN